MAAFLRFPLFCQTFCEIENEVRSKGMEAPGTKLKESLSLFKVYDQIGAMEMNRIKSPIISPMIGVTQVALNEFVSFWDQLYTGYDEEAYQRLKKTDHPLTSDLIKQWFEWKNGTPLSAKKMQSISRYSSSDERINQNADEASLTEFLCRTGGAIWRIFWLHIQHPETFPIYDRHVHRAMAFMVGPPTPEEIPTANPAKVESYLKTYRPFFERFAEVIFTSRQVDRALMSFGQYLNTDCGRHAAGRPKKARKAAN
jgi:hypothetical protein